MSSPTTYPPHALSLPFEDKDEKPYYAFQSFGSGSSGNCSILSYKGTNLLIDLGIGARILAKTLKDHQISPSSLHGILVTHDHADHIRGVAPFATRYGLPVFASKKVAQALLSNRMIHQDLSGHLKRIPTGEEFQIGTLKIRSFTVPHDAHDNVGYTLSSEAGTFTLITDIGHITADIEETITRTNFLVIESNYDEDMLRDGHYPQHLKDRITSGFGHISNRQCADTIARLHHPRLKSLILCHLSGDNNTPEIALRTMTETLTSKGILPHHDIDISVLKRGKASPRYKLTIPKEP